MMAFLGACWSFVAVLAFMAVVSSEQIDGYHLKSDETSKGSAHVFYKDPWPQDEIMASTATTMLSAVCPIDVCENGGRCHMVNGEPRCLCKQGFVGDRCQDFHLHLSCDPDRMTFKVLKSALQELNVNMSLLHMSNPICKPLVTSALHISVTLTHENHTVCGTVVQVNGSHLIYTNELSTRTVEEGVAPPNSMISRSSDIHIGFSCIYRYDQVVSLPFPLVTSAALATFVVKEGEFNVTMTLHPTVEYLEPYSHPPVIPLNSQLYVQLQIHGHGPQNYFTLKLEECWATPWAPHGSTVRHILITNGIANDSTVDMIESGNKSLSRFSLRMFHFIKYQEVYLHCRIWLCHSSSKHCHQQPRPDRQKRELSDPYRKVVSCGPVQLAGSVRTSVEESESGLGALVLAGSFAAGIVLLILSSVALAKAFKKIKPSNPYHVELLP